MALLFSGSFLWDFLGVIVAVFAVIYTSFKWFYGHWKRKNVKYMEPTFPFGNITNLLSKEKISFMERTLKFYKYGKDNKLDFYGLFFFKTPVLLLRNLDLIKSITVTDFDRWNDRGMFINEEDDPLSAHLLNIGGEKWLNVRKKVTPVFTPSKLKQMFKTISDCTVNLENFMEENLKTKKPIDMKAIAGNFTVDVIGSCALGIDCNAFDGDCLFRKYGNKVIETKGFDYIKMIFVNAWPELALKLRLKSIAPDVSDFFLTVVRNTVQYRKVNNVTRNDFLQILIDLEKENYAGDGTSLTITEMAAQTIAFFVAGFETSATTITFTLFSMSENQNIQNKVRKEIFEVLKKHNNEINHESITEMRYLEQVIQETLRMYPPLADVSRKCMKDYKLPGTDIIIDKGTLAFIPIAGFHYDEEYFPNPHHFDPDRFSPENKHTIKPFSYMPFGCGRRICIGDRFGMQQVKIGLVALLSKYKFTINERTEVPLKWNPFNFILSAKGDIWLDYEKI